MFNEFFLEVELVHPHAKMPTRATNADAGLDFYTPTELSIPPQTDALIPLGVKTRFPNGYALIMKEKSGIATKKQLSVGACVVDSEYRGVVHAHLFNHGNATVTFNAGDKVIQGVIVPVWAGQPTQVENIENDTARGEGGFGSSGNQ